MRALLLTACVVAAAACGGEESRVQFSVQGDVDVLRPLLTVTATAGDWALVVDGDEIATDGSPTRSPEFDTPGSGTLTVEAVLREPGGPTLADGSIELELREDWVWGVDLHLADTDPAAMCFGCLGSAAFPVPDTLTGDPRDSLFIVWGGNSISDPVVY